MDGASVPLTESADGSVFQKFQIICSKVLYSMR
ncbi:hypothetical protein [Pseudomonas phage BL3]|nr:hypothetical protein [Pseudomonas phage BL3]